MGYVTFSGPVNAKGTGWENHPAGVTECVVFAVLPADVRTVGQVVHERGVQRPPDETLVQHAVRNGDYDRAQARSEKFVHDLPRVQSPQRFHNFDAQGG